jgi:HEAT repeat protein
MFRLIHSGASVILPAMPSRCTAIALWLFLLLAASGVADPDADCADRSKGPRAFKFGTHPDAAQLYDVRLLDRLEKPVPGITKALSSADDQTRYKAMHKVRELVMSSADAGRLLHAMLRDPCYGVAHQATMTLILAGHRIAPEEAPRHFSVDAEPVDWADAAARKAELEWARRALRCKLGTNAGVAAQLLSIYGAPMDLPALRALSDHPNVYVQLQAALALRALGDTPGSNQMLKTLTRSSETYYATEASRLLGRPPPAPGPSESHPR